MDKLHKYAQKYCDGEVIISSNGTYRFVKFAFSIVSSEKNERP